MTIAQPLLDRLQHNPGYITQEGLGAADLAWIVTALLLLPPLWLLAVEGLAALFGPSARRRVHQVCIAGLLVLLIVSLLREPLESLRQRGIPAGWLTLLIGVVAAWWPLHSYRRGGWASSLVTFLAIGLIVFPVMFFASRQIAAVCFPPPTPLDLAHAGNPVPVVVVIFDSLAGMSLLDEHHQIDAARYPNFARLAGTSTYYRNASTVHHRTDNAVPSILSGRFPHGDQLPVLSEYPLNLFTLLEESGQYQLTVFEPFTRLCPSSLRYLPTKTTMWERVTKALYTLGTVYLERSIPHDLPPQLPRIPLAWFRQPEGDADLYDVKTGLMIYPWDANRHGQIDHFLKCIEPAERPSLLFLHLVVPHYPWIYLPNGHRYLKESSSAESPLGAHGKVGEDWGPDPLAARNAWQRYLLQLGYADRVLGRILDRLSSTGMLDSSLLVVMADHGVAFEAGHSRREPVQETMASILPVPLFIKLPGQTTGAITDRNVESIDILPTIADVLDMDIPVRPGHAPVDGASLLDPRESPRPRKTLILSNGLLPMDADFPERFKYIDKLRAEFGTGVTTDRRWECAVHPEWVGRSLADFSAGPSSDLQIEMIYGGDTVDPEQPDIIPCYFQGRVLVPEKLDQPRTLLVAVNGEVGGVTRTLADPDASTGWSVLVDESRFQTGKNDVAFYEVLENAGEVELRACASSD